MGRRSEKVKMRTGHCEVLARRGSTDARKGDGHEGRGIESRKEGRNKASTGKVGLNGRNANSIVVAGLGINEGTQEVKSEAGGKKKHDGAASKLSYVDARSSPNTHGICCHVVFSYKEKIEIR
jgi:hypothetical protein